MTREQARNYLRSSGLSEKQVNDIEWTCLLLGNIMSETQLLDVVKGLAEPSTSRWNRAREMK